MMKKGSFLVLTAILMAVPAGCSLGGLGEKANAGEGKGKQLEVSVANGSYILTGEDDGVSEKDTGVLMVNFKVKNTSDKSLTISSMDGIKLYKGEEEMSPKKSVYSTDLGLEADMSGSIGANKEKTIPVFFDVEKGEKYEIGISARTEDYKKTKEVTLKLDTEKYAESLDQMEEPAKALTAYIETIYLDKENPDFEKLVSADKQALQEEAKTGFKDGLKLIVYNSLPEQELVKHYTSYKSVLAQKAELKAEPKAFANDRAVVKLEYSTVPLRDSYDKMSDLEDEYREKTNDYDTKKGQSYAMSKFPAVLNSLDVQPGRDPLEIKMMKKDGKWMVDSNDYNTESLVDVFAKGSR
ncbi:DUF5105 domain-containing protein [Bacillus sp. FJAT-42376]|uniref:DUF5105 domain-containing protein n=1 Tax=Bacillus sp. FJAT-42376 TaxID=2014076 RepID=UPI000F515AA6|nr:DUF5105 domain-containing protein [Bacillus sp. FJAT-42376]AZB41086.1 DUF5105 domain-containing protein [Bacillus sp. FJAT-42376]